LHRKWRAINKRESFRRLINPEAQVLFDTLDDHIKRNPAMLYDPTHGHRKRII
jgi:hypothetical protein